MANYFDQFDEAPEGNFFDQFDAPANDSVTEEGDKETGFFSNAARLAGERAADIGGNLSTFVSQAGNYLEEKMPMGGFVFEDGKLPRYAGADEYKRLKQGGMSDLAVTAGDKLRDVDLGGEHRHTPDSVKQEWKGGNYLGAAGEAGKFAGETFIQSTADMAAMIGSLPVYISSFATELGRERAQNKGKAEADIGDTAEALPFAVGVALLDRILPSEVVAAMSGAAKQQLAKEVGEEAAKKVLPRVAKAATVSAGKEVGEEAAKKVLPRVAKAATVDAGKEALTEAFQEGVLEYVATRYGTDAEMSVGEAFEAGAWAGLAGAGGGLVMGGAKGALEKPGAKRVEDDNAPPEDELEKVERELQALNGDVAKFKQLNALPPPPIYVEPTGPDQVGGNANTGMDQATPWGTPVEQAESVPEPTVDAIEPEESAPAQEQIGAPENTSPGDPLLEYASQAKTIDDLESYANGRFGRAEAKRMKDDGTIERVWGEARGEKSKSRFSLNEPERAEWKQAEEKGLDMSKDARMQRARDMGFDTDAVYTHESPDSSEITEIKSGGKFGAIFSLEGDRAGYYENTQDFVVRGGVADNDDLRQYVSDNYEATEEWIRSIAEEGVTDEQIEMVSESLVTEAETNWDEIGEVLGADPEDMYAEMQKRRGELASKAGYGAVTAQDEFGRSIMLLPGSKVRSVNAAFDPDYKDSPKLLANLNGQPKAKGLKRSDVIKHLDPIAKSTGSPIKVVQSERELPTEIQNEIKTQGYQGRARGIYQTDTGEAYVIADNLDSIGPEVVKTYLHEVVGHKGIRAATGKRLNITLSGIHRDMPNADRNRLKNKYASQLEGKDEQEQGRIIADEYVAELAEADPKNTFVQRVIAAIRRWIRNINPDLTWSDNDIIELLRVGKKQLKKGADTKTKEGSRFDKSEIEKRNRKIIGSDPLLAAWTSLALDDKAFQLPVSESGSLEQIFKDLEGDAYKLEKDKTLSEGMDSDVAWFATTPQGKTAFVLQKGKSVWVDVSELAQGDGGRRIYNAVANYAFNNGLTFKGDPAGLSDIAMTRRLENMISSALKFGTTKHLWPHERQEEGGPMVPAIKWKDGDDAFNLTQMIKASYNSVARQFPEIRDLRYNPETDVFEDTVDGSEFTEADFENLIKEKRSSRAGGLNSSGGKGRMGSAPTAGRRTIERAVLTHTVLRGTREEQSQILARFSQLGSQRLKGSLYALNDLESGLESLGLKKKESKPIAETIAKIRDRNFLEAQKNRLYEGIFDGLVGIYLAEKSVGKGIAAGDYEGSGYVGARLATGIGDLMHAILHYGAPKWAADRGVVEYKPGTKGLLEIFKSLDGDLDAWLGWMGGNRGEELMNQGRENNLTRNEILALKAQILTDGKLDKAKAKKFNDAKKAYNEINKAMLDLSQEAGLINGLERNKWESEWYVPFYRQAEGNLLAPRNKRGLSHQSSGIKALKGGELATSDLLENILTNWMKLADSSMKNMALLKTVENLDGTDYLSDQSLKYTSAVVPKSEIVKRIKGDRNYLMMIAEQLGMDQTAAEMEVLHELNKLDQTGFEKLWAITAPTDPDVIRVMKGGKAKYYKVNTEIDGGSLLRAIKHLDNQGMNNLLMRGARNFKRLLTTGVTSSPDFMLRNLIRDAAHAWAINKDGFVFGKDTLKGIKGAFSQDEDYRELMFANASFQGGYVHGSDPEQSAQLMRRALEKKGLSREDIDLRLDSIPGLTKKGWGGVKRAWQYYREQGDKLENANRLATFKAAKAAGKSLTQAVFESRDLMDYSLRGNYEALIFFTDVIPFLNARLQGLSKLGRAAEFKGEALKPWTWRMDKRLGIALTKITLFSAALALLNWDDDRYQELEDWEKDAYWHIFLGKHHVRIPKPFEIGIIAGTIPERIVHAWILDTQPDDKVLWSLKHGTLETLNINPIPQAVLPVVELWANKSFHFDTPIETLTDQRKLPKDRHNAYTSDTAIWLGDLTGTSPKQLEHVWKGYTGTMGAYALSAIDAVAGINQPNKGELLATDIPILKSFYRGTKPNYRTQYATDLYDRLKEVNQLAASLKEVNPEDKADFLDKHHGKLRFKKLLNTASGNLSRLRKIRDRIVEDPDMDRKEKQRRLDQIQERMNAIAQKAAERTEEAF